MTRTPVLHCLRRSHSRPKTRPFKYRPNLEELENRTVPSLGVPNVLVNSTAEDGTSTHDTQSESSTIAFGGNVLTAYNDSFASASGHFTGYSLSTNGGTSFT